MPFGNKLALILKESRSAQMVWVTVSHNMQSEHACQRPRYGIKHICLWDSVDRKICRAPNSHIPGLADHPYSLPEVIPSTLDLPMSEPLFPGHLSSLILRGSSARKWPQTLHRGPIIWVRVIKSGELRASWLANRAVVFRAIRAVSFMFWMMLSNKVNIVWW